MCPPLCPPFCCAWKRKPRFPETTPLHKVEEVARPTTDYPKSAIVSAHSPRAVEQPQLPDVPEGLPSQVDKTLEDCPKFRIVLVGNSGVGKSSLIRSIFNIDQDKIDIADGRAGHADIVREYNSSVNPRFILHDSKGFEAGSGTNWDTVEKFLRNRWESNLPERIHAIWFCIKTPFKGGRLLQTGDENLLKLAKEFKIPIIAVFTKYDRLVTECWRQDDQSGKSVQKRLEDAEKKASDFFRGAVDDLKNELVKLSTGLSVSCVKVSTKDQNAQHTLIDLTNETRRTLREVEEKLQVLWVAVQQVNASQKVDVSISEGFKKYWRDLGGNSAFEDQILIDCIHRIHDDVLKVWNFNDPTKILSGTKFFTEMIGLLKPLIDDQVKKIPLLTEPEGYGKTGAIVLVPLLHDFGFDVQATQYLCSNYKKYPSTAKLLATYIINLVSVLFRVFTDILSTDPPRALGDPRVSRILENYKTSAQANFLDDNKTAKEFKSFPGQVIERVIRERLGLTENSEGSVQ